MDTGNPAGILRQTRREPGPSIRSDLDQCHDVQWSKGGDVPGVFALGQHHGRVLGSGKRLQVALLFRVHGWIDPHHGARGIQRCVQQSPPRGCLVPWGNAILQIEDDDVRKLPAPKSDAAT